MMNYFSMGSFVGGFMLGVLLVGAWTVTQNFSLPFSEASNPITANPRQGPESGAITVMDQPAGSTVMINSIDVTERGVWVAVREVNGTSLGNVLGAARITGPQKDVSVQLLRTTVPDSPYVIQLYRDDGSETFELGADSVYIDFATGAPVISYFVTTN